MSLQLETATARPGDSEQQLRCAPCSSLARALTVLQLRLFLLVPALAAVQLRVPIIAAASCTELSLVANRCAGESESRD